jgi:HEAT repeat protein
MPLIKRESAGKAADRSHEPPDLVAGDLRHPDPERRWSAARRLGERPGAVDQLSSALKEEKEPRVLEAIITSLIRIGGEQSAMALLPCLRSDDATLRVGVIEALQMMPGAVLPHMAKLLQDPDSDVRIVAVELARKMPRERATSLLCDMLDREDHPNACGAAIDVLAEVGTLDALPCLERLRARFAQDPFLPFAISAAVESIRKNAN